MGDERADAHQETNCAAKAIRFTCGAKFLTMTNHPRRLITATLLLTALFLPAAVVQAADAAKPEASDDETPLHHKMEDMGRALRALNKGLSSADPAAVKADLLDAVQKMQVLAVESKLLTPATIEKLPAAERPAKIAEYRADLASTIQTMLELERAILADDWAKAKTQFQSLRTHRKDGHEKFNPEEEEKK